jgi:hypothetical protein
VYADIGSSESISGTSILIVRSITHLFFGKILLDSSDEPTDEAETDEPTDEAETDEPTDEAETDEPTDEAATK